MHSRLLRARVWLDHNGLFPRGKLSFFTLYVLALDLLLLVIEKVVGMFRGSVGASLSGWIIFLTLLSFALLSLLAARTVSARLLWRLRNRLIVTYAFVGVLPLLVLAALAGLTLYLFSGQFATYIVTSKLELHLRALRANDLVLAYKIANDLDSNRESDFGRHETNKPGELRELQITGWLDDKFLFADPPLGERVTTPVLPKYLPADFNQVVRDEGRLFLRSAVALQTKHGKLAVISSKPLDRSLLQELAANLGEVTLFASGLTIRQLDQDAASLPGFNVSSKNPTQKGANYLDTGAGPPKPTYVVGAIPPPTRIFDFSVRFPTSIAVVNWIDGNTSEPAAIQVHTRLSALYEQLFAAPGEFAPTLEIILVVATIVLAVILAVALFIGSRLSRSITGAVAQLYLATTHVNRGDFSHRIPVTSTDQLAALANSFNSMTESTQKLIVEQKEKQRLENEITIAQEVQAQLFPRHITQLPSLEVHGFCRPARSVSGDYYDFLSLGPERLLLAVGDVSGKGISAALLMATIHSAVRAYSVEGVPALRQVQAVGGRPALVSRVDSVIEGAEAWPGKLLSLLNHQLYHSTPQEKYATLFLAMYDADDRRLTFSNAGHLPPVVLSETGIVKRLEDGGTVVGLFDDITYDEDFVQLRPGEIFLAYSDGVTEPENDFGEFGEQRLIELVQENRDLPLARITEIVTAAVDDWIGAAEQPDDVTLVLARAR
ncbi:MAG: serine phosphatase [Acidobacteriaceae bacterium]|nr:serine phosphatase [Acidobacteriaceae bacterium]